MTFRSKTSWSTKQRKHARQRNHCHCCVRPCPLIVTDQHTVQSNSFFPRTTMEWNRLDCLMYCPVQLFLPWTTMEWNHLDWPVHCPMQFFFSMHHSGMEPLTNALPSTTHSSHSPQQNGTTDQRTAQYSSFFPLTTAEWNHWPTHCPVQLFLPTHHSGWNHLDWPRHCLVQLFLPMHQWNGTTD